VQIDVQGAWTVDGARRYGNEAREAFPGSTREIRTLTSAAEPSAEQVYAPRDHPALTSSGVRNRRPEDLIAAVVPSAVMKLQIRRMFTDRGVALCDTVAEAES